jgi:hypothetical protein
MRLKKLVEKLQELTDQIEEQEDLEDEDIVPRAINTAPGKILYMAKFKV